MRTELDSMGAGPSERAPLKSSRVMIRRRREKIIALLYRHGSRGVGELAAEAGVSEATVRRDLGALESQGIIVRRWGAAEMRAEVNYRSTFKRRMGQRDVVKQSLALAAADMVTPNMVIGLSGGTTCTQLAWALYDRPANIVTNAVNIAIEMHALRRAKVILTGGVLKPNSYELVGAAAAEIIRSYNIEVFFFSCSGVSARGYTRRDYAEAAIVRSFMAVSQHNVMLVDDTKLDRDHDTLIAGFGEVDTVLCNEQIPPVWLDRMASGGATVTIVPAASIGQLRELEEAEERGAAPEGGSAELYGLPLSEMGTGEFGV